jgi:hypothetical protein
MSDIIIGRMLRDARFAENMTQQEVADALGVSLWTYNRLENGRRHFDEAWIERLPVGLRQPIVKYMESRCHAQLDFLRRVLQPQPALPRPKLMRGDSVPALTQRPRFVRGDARAAA